MSSSIVSKFQLIGSFEAGKWFIFPVSKKSSVAYNLGMLF
ncbi:hypothetical protein AB434_0928 [Heyndrickxia coagulans]|uniref:Uncharacterized protein n=1 Tax=Heyndrickxia coagulans TaxID=1398 RepID=A0A0C5CI67_HEYCO|nr:hypothetical protein SB48_HM08orf00355 [Heyndrickxia coagulans]AKN53333.1 hypothetical protein AB434_0928 [Heyndrickxia coagulans]KWZ85309.1 hypothetical protein HMPREF3213_00481 [Heyndrickxia coagulans]KYC62550.1 hypothetical protein B4100_1601 [Heyndrickxia coagulans]KYC86434.1 hypothetical protein B4096_1543 [Heyndrickxia coagulans]